MKIVMGDLNAKIGGDNEGYEDVMGRQALGEIINNNGERLRSWCSTNSLKIGGSLFKHKNIHKGTWRSPDGTTVNQIDHICFSSRWTSSVQDVRSYRGADVASDHYLVMARIKVKLKARSVTKNATKQPGFNVIQLKDEEVHTRYNVELQNRFEALEWATNIADEWENIKQVFNKTAETVIGKRRGTKKERWITERTWKSIDERRTLKGKKEQIAGIGGDIAKITEEYREKDKEVKKNCKKDKQQWINQKANEAEEAAEVGNTKVLYQIVKELAGNNTSRPPIKQQGEH